MLVEQNSNIFEQLIQAYVTGITHLGVADIKVRAHEGLKFIELSTDDKGVTVVVPTTYHAPSEVDILFIDRVKKRAT